MLPGPKYSKEQKARFFELLDRDGSVKAAADAVGVNVNAACGSGYRASIATSLLDRAGVNVVLIDDAFAKAGEHGLTAQ